MLYFLPSSFSYLLVVFHFISASELVTGVTCVFFHSGGDSRLDFGTV